MGAAALAMSREVVMLDPKMCFAISERIFGAVSAQMQIGFSKAHVSLSQQSVDLVHEASGMVSRLMADPGEHRENRAIMALLDHPPHLLEEALQCAAEVSTESVLRLPAQIATLLEFAGRIRSCEVDFLADMSPDAALKELITCRDPSRVAVLAMAINRQPGHELVSCSDRLSA